MSLSAMSDPRTSELVESVERRLSSLESYSLTQLRGCRGPPALLADLSDEIRDDVAILQGLLEDLALAAEDEDTQTARLQALDRHSKLSFKLDSLRRQIREASLNAKRYIDSQAAASQRDELLKTASRAAADRNSSGSANHASKGDELMSATSNVTDGLRRTRQLMEQELERSSLSAQMLERSSQTLSLTSDQYTSFSDLLGSSRKLITALEKADVLDRLLITAALIFFFLVCLLIIKRRIIDRGLRAANLVGKVAGSVGQVGRKGMGALLDKEYADATATMAASVSSLTAAASTLLSHSVYASSSRSSPNFLSTIEVSPANSDHGLPTPSNESVVGGIDRALHASHLDTIVPLYAAPARTEEPSLESTALTEADNDSVRDGQDVHPSVSRSHNSLDVTEERPADLESLPSQSALGKPAELLDIKQPKELEELEEEDIDVGQEDKQAATQLGLLIQSSAAAAAQQKLNVYAGGDASIVAEDGSDMPATVTTSGLSDPEPIRTLLYDQSDMMERDGSAAEAVTEVHEGLQSGGATAKVTELKPGSSSSEKADYMQEDTSALPEDIDHRPESGFDELPEEDHRYVHEEL